jgi:nickel/cobalt exporter
MDFSQLLQQGEAHAWLFVPTAILLGALHGMEPGHSKTMMAAFIIAVRGTVMQAVMLGLSAAISHSLIIWILAAAALRYGSKWSVETTEPYFQIVSGVMIAGLAVWMFWRTRRDERLATAHQHDHANEGPHGGKMVDTGHGSIELAVFETGVPPRFRLYFADTHGTPHLTETAPEVTVETVRPDGATQVFQFVRKEDATGPFLESTTDIPEPHEFTARLTLTHGDHAHTHQVAYSEDDHHHHEHADVSNLTAGEFADAHEQAHAADIAKRFTNRTVTTPQIIWFGITGGLMPCPAAFTILLVCLQLKRFTLGFTLVAAFSFGLAITMVASGVLAAWGLRHAEKRIKNFNKFARRAPYFSAALLTLLAIFFITQGWRHLAHAAT